MSEPNETRPTPLGIYDRQAAEKITAIEIIALSLSAVWLFGAAIFFLLLPSDAPADETASGSLRFMMTMMAVFMPVGMIWVAATAARSSKIMREESQRLQSAIDAIRHAYIVQSQSGKISAEPSVARKLDEIAAAQRKTETALATFTSSRDNRSQRPAAAAPEAQSEAQTALPLGTTAQDMAPSISREEFIRAINFPETADDTVGFNALRRALKDRAVAGLVQAAQDVLTLLSQDGIYMDDLNPDMARPEIWRQFAQGTRGRQIASLGGVRDRSSLALTSGRMREDPIFRDAVHHFLRRFDKSFVQFEAEASDSEISELAGTRTARAFMLLGRVAGVFD
ncbi:hypothetical protein [Lentibacter sp. XHP0401]|jgi:hypothetical protein|uniref:hypothetical protein n=1 Tax=Lentibacter sp. XHP0401 TaxID=2984334 RepID=UPI0021E8374D|nr:hypothetical protein [Lentibacter sp. XHP0401]MCV2892936.1 hypothetical protein [Lentibacter sp. XHP0401]